jgi:hypothetical protein
MLGIPVLSADADRGGTAPLTVAGTGREHAEVSAPSQRSSCALPARR